MKINILSKIIDIPSGGGNQFLKALQKEFTKQNIYENNPFKADIILFNSFNFIEDEMFFKLLKLKKLGKRLVHRIDGPISLYRGRDIELDKIIYDINTQLADATIFQSYWSREENYKLGMHRKLHETVIMNAPDANIFNIRDKKPFVKEEKIKLIATSWSNNINKGFEVYEWLDNNLDFKKYDMTFVGNSPIKFQNIKHIKPLNSEKLSLMLKSSGIYITASKKDPCSNSLIEALHCGLPALVLKDGGHPEIVQNAGEVFVKKEEISHLLEKIVNNYTSYVSNRNVKDLSIISKEYVDFLTKDMSEEKPASTLKSTLILIKYYLWRVKRKLIK